MTNKEKILKFLQNNIRYSYNAPTIYQHFKGRIPLNTIRSELKRLYEEKTIIKPDRGFYRAKVDRETIDLIENPPTQLHAITINATSPKLQKIGQGPLPTNCRFKTEDDFKAWLGFEGFKVKKYHRNSEKSQFYKTYWFDDRDVVVTIHCSGLLVFHFGCSSHPLGYYEFRDMYNNLLGKVDPLCPLVDEVVTQIGINKDFSEIELDGFTSLRLKQFTNAWFQVYQKESIRRVRFECHINPKPCLGVSDAFLMIESLSSPFKSGSGGVDNSGGMFR